MIIIKEKDIDKNLFSIFYDRYSFILDIQDKIDLVRLSLRNENISCLNVLFDDPQISTRIEDFYKTKSEKFKNFLTPIRRRIRINNIL
jgi:hypothetical protein